MALKTPRCLTLIGTASLQRYVFASNRLRENVGASGLVQAPLLCWKERFATVEPKRMNAGWIYVGGGNAALLFDSKPDAINAIRDWSRSLLTVAPGLRVVVAHEELSDGDLAARYEAALKELARNKNSPPFGAPVGALPVVRTCPSTGLAASKYSKNSDSWLSAEAAAKNETTDQGLQEYSTVDGNRWVLPLELSDLDPGQQEMFLGMRRPTAG